ncbi:helix-turn-helix domain-containing protein [Hyphococcus flavus]|uniref:Helix-turn-helix domain-containing protein n=1 Tax=Hyphococcus flavus TaxID=1866326 RepID=A0AAE9ZCD8_9PROT|nr:helix-turn-helix domain-containing protein [Hyphococcus flavus]WDI32214.1 helix-turn-helix domain-containing protein [Hyphococcus flavus]
MKQAAPKGGLFCYVTMMEGFELNVPVRQLVNVVTLAQAIIFAAMLAPRAHRVSPAGWLLVSSLLILATVKADQLYQGLGLLHQFPDHGFLLAPFQALMTPALYLYVCAKTDRDFKLHKGHLWHASLFALFFLYLFVFYFRLAPEAKAAMIESGFSGPLHRLVIPLIGDLVQLGYVIAALRRLQKFGVSLENWFSRTEDRNLLWLKRLMTLWGAIFVLHAAWTAAAGIFGAAPFARGVMDLLNFAHLAIANALAAIGFTDAASPARTEQPRPAEKYAGSALSADDRDTLFNKISKVMTDDALYLSPDLTLRDLAERAGATPRELSEAINGAGGVTFFEFVNRARVEHARRLLIDQPGLQVLSIAHQSGFNSKTAFNESFRKATGETPTGYRRRALAGRTVQSVEKPA